MLYITLVCAAGMSTSMLVQKMEESAKQMGIAAEIKAMPEGTFAEYTGQTDILLLGPQVRFKLKSMKETYEAKGMKVDLIDMMDYGRMNGEKVLKKAIEMSEGA